MVSASFLFLCGVSIIGHFQHVAWVFAGPGGAVWTTLPLGLPILSFSTLLSPHQTPCLPRLIYHNSCCFTQVNALFIGHSFQEGPLRRRNSVCYRIGEPLGSPLVSQFRPHHKFSIVGLFNSKCLLKYFIASLVFIYY